MLWSCKKDKEEPWKWFLQLMGAVLETYLCLHKIRNKTDMTLSLQQHVFFWEIGSTCSHPLSLYGNTNLLCVPLYSDIYTFKAFVLNGFPQTAASYNTIKTPPSYDFTRSSAFHVNFFQQGNSSLWLACIQYHMPPSSNSTIVAVFLVAALVSLQRTAEVYPSAWFAPPLAACFRCFPNS